MRAHIDVRAKRVHAETGVAANQPGPRLGKIGTPPYGLRPVPINDQNHLHPSKLRLDFRRRGYLVPRGQTGVNEIEPIVEPQKGGLPTYRLGDTGVGAARRRLK